jgi:gliding motility-associated-like protein
MKKNSLIFMTTMLIFNVVINIKVVGQNTFMRLAQVPGLNFGMSFSPTSDGGFVSTGQDNGAGGHGDCDVYVLKVDECGVTEWYYRYGGTGGDGGKSIVQSADGGYLVAGLTSLSNTGLWDTWVIKLNAAGILQWSRSFATSKSDFGLTVAETPTGGILFGGFNTLDAANPAYITPIGAAIEDANNYRPFIVKLDSIGTVIWEKQYNLPQGWGNSLQVSASGDIYYSGSYVKNLTDWQVFVLKADANGNVIWVNDYGTGALNDVDGVNWDVNSTLNPDGTLVVGFSNSIASTTTDYDTHLMKLDVNGNVIWNTKVGTAVADRSHFVSKTLDGGYIQTGFSISGGIWADNVDPASMVTNCYALINKFDANGNHVFTKHYGQAGTITKAWGARETSDMGILLCTETTGFGALYYDPLFIKTDSLGNSPTCSVINPLITVSSPTIAKTNLAPMVVNTTNYDKGYFTSTSIPVIPTEVIVCQNCSNKPSVIFTDTVICANDSVGVFNNTTTGLVCQQRIGSIDSTNIGAYAPQQAKDTVFFKYTVPGIYYIAVDAPCANNAAGSVKYQKIIVKPLPVANFTVGNVCNNKAIEQNDNSVGSIPAISGVVISKWEWNFGDGTPPVSSKNTTHNYTTPGLKTTVLKVESSIGCTDTITKKIYVHDVPKTTLFATNKCLYSKALFTGLTLVPADSLLVNSGATINASDTLSKYEWDFDKNGTIDVTRNDTNQYKAQKHLYNTSANYWIKLKVSTKYCSKTDSININIYPNPIIGLTLKNVCKDSAVSFIETSTVTDNATNPSVPASSIKFLSMIYGDGGLPTIFPNYPPPNPFMHTYATADTFRIKQVIRTNNNCYAKDTTKKATIFPKPLASFVMNDTCLTKQTTFKPTATVPLANGSTNNIVQWQWDFNNDGTKEVYNTTNADATTIYPNSDTSKYVSLVVKTNHGCKDSISKKIKVHPNPVAKFTARGACFPRATVFTNQSSISTGNINANKWTFDVTGSSTLVNPTYTYLFPNTHSVQLVVTSNFGCKDSIVKKAEVFPLPTPALLTAPVCLDSVISVNDISTVNNLLPNPIVPSPKVDSVYFIYGDGSVPSKLKAPNLSATHLYANAGKYYITHIVKSSNGCYMLAKDSVVIYPKPIADFTFTKACIQQPTVFTPTEAIVNTAGSTSTVTNWYWDYTSNKTVEVSNTTNVDVPYVYPSADTNKYATLVVKTNHGCKDSIAYKIIVNPNPTVSFAVNDVCVSFPSEFVNLTTVQANNTFTSEWFFNTTDKSSVQNPQYTYTNPNIYPVKLIATTNNGCKDSLTVSAVVNPKPVVDFDIKPRIICQPDFVTYTDKSSVGAVPAGSIITDYAWNFGNLLQVQGSQGQLLLTDTGNYDVTLTAYTNKGCTNFKTIANYVRVNLKPTALFYVSPTQTTMLNPIITVRDSSKNGNIFNWNMGDTLFSSFGKINIFNYVYKDTGEYTITQLVKTTQGCTDTMQATVYIKANWAVYVPNSFTPNSDGINDFFNAKGSGLFVYKLRIFDRWGQVVALVENIESKGWDGTDIRTGAKLKADVYTWSLEFSDINNYEQKRTGTITLLR